MRTKELKNHFIRCLDRLLQDERGRDFLREKIRQNELPVIEMIQNCPAQSAQARHTKAI